jgi:hypothetical protein
MQPTMDTCAWIYQAQDSSWRPYVLRNSDAAMRSSESPTHVYYPWQGFQRGLYIKEVQLQRCQEHQVFQDLPLPCHRHVGATATIFVAAHPTGTSLERSMDGCCHYHFRVKTSFKPGRKCRRRTGLGRSSKDLNRMSCHNYPARRGD